MTAREFQRKLTGEWRQRCLGALLVAVLGLIVFESRLGQGLDHWSYDLLFLFEARPAPEEVMIVRLDEDAYGELHQRYGQEWDRGLHARLLKQLREGQAKLVVFDVWFIEPGDTVTNHYLADAIRAQGKVVLAGDLTEDSTPGFVNEKRPRPPLDVFRQAATADWGIDQVELDSDFAVRRHYRGTEVFPSLAWAAASKLKAPVTQGTDRAAFFKTARWVRYYDPDRAFASLSYKLALEEPPAYFRDKIVFIGGKPHTGYPGEVKDVFATPMTRWTHALVSGVDIHATMFLNLLHGDWLTRLPKAWELLLVLASGVAAGFGLSMGRIWLVSGVAMLAALLVATLAFLAAGYQNVWFGWLTIAGVEIPAAWVWTVLARQRAGPPVTAEVVPIRIQEIDASSQPSNGFAITVTERAPVTPLTRGRQTSSESEALDSAPPISGHTLLRRVGGGSYGEVWLARDVIGSFHVVKIVHRDRFRSIEPFEREFRGMQKFTPVSRSHPGFVHVLHVDRNDEAGYFYYIMEPADDEVSGQKIEPDSYRPKTLASELDKRSRLPIEECLSLSLSLAAALDCLHRQHLIHRDLKPSNIIFVQGQPKLADIGLVTELGPPGRDVTYVGTEGYLAPEGPGTPAADVYSLGKVIYQAAMGRDCAQFPEMPTTLVENAAEMGPLLDLNEIILKACSPVTERYQTAGELHAALKLLQEHLKLPNPL